MKTITSTQNPEVKVLDKLKTPKGRDQEGKFLAEGIRVCGALIGAGASLIQVYCTEKMKDFAVGFTDEASITLVSQAVMDKISPSVTPSGLVCVFTIPESPSDDQLETGIVLASINDPGNMGTLIRTATAMGIKNVVIIEGTDPWAPKVIQATAGTILQTNIFQWSWDKLIKNKKSLNLCPLVVTGGKHPSKIDFTNTLLVIGNEAHGIPEKWLDQCEQRMSIPMVGSVESLNAAVAGSIALYLAFGTKC